MLPRKIVCTESYILREKIWIEIVLLAVLQVRLILLLKIMLSKIERLSPFLNLSFQFKQQHIFSIQ